MKRQRLGIGEGIFFVTLVTKDRYPYFQEAFLCSLFIDQLKFAKQVCNFRLYGFVVMPDYAHLLVQPAEKAILSQLMHCIKHAGAQKRGHKFLWRISFDEHLIRNARDLNNHLMYLWLAPEAEGLVEDYRSYPYSSFRYFHDLIDGF